MNSMMDARALVRSSLLSCNSHGSSLACVRPQYKLKLNQRPSFLNSKCRVFASKAVSAEKEVMESKSGCLSALEILKTSAAGGYTKESSSIIATGINFKTAPVEIREKVSIPEAQWPQAISELCDLNHIDEAAVFSTSNRMEVYVYAHSQHHGVKEVTDWMSKRSGVPTSELLQHRFLLFDQDATRHLFEVSSGLDSLVIGEGQILAQVKRVVTTGQGVPGFGREIGGLFKHSITTGKRVRTETSISSGSVSVSSAAVELAQMMLPDHSYENARVCVIGAGKMGKEVIKHLGANGCKNMVVVNRTEDRVADIRHELKDVEITYSSLSGIFAGAVEAHAIFTCTASDSPLFLKEQVEKFLPVRQRLFMDISVPRNFGSCVSDLETARVYNVDDLKEFVLAKAKAIIDDEVRNFESWKDSLEAVPTIKKLRAYAERIRASEMKRCWSKLGNDITESQKKVIDVTSSRIVNKLLHGPMEHLRCGGNDNRSLTLIRENMHAVNRMYELDTENSVLEEKVKG